MNTETKPKQNVMKTVAAWIVRARYLFFVLFFLACIYCAMSVGKVKTNGDLTAFLPPETETRQGLTVMEDEFVTYASASVMVANITYARAAEYAEEIRSLPHVTDVAFDDSPVHYADSSALFSISFDGASDDPEVVGDMQTIREMLADCDLYVSSEIGMDFSAEIASEMVGVLAIAIVVIIGVLLVTSRSYFEVVIFLIVFVVAALLNMGTNFWLGEISSITNSIAVILQLALAIDYAIIFSHRYQDEADVYDNAKDAMIEALSKAIVEISASSLTTISGLVALTLMQFRLGYDLGVVLSKGIVCSLLTVFLLMPGLILLFPRLLKKTAHRSLVPNVEGWGRFLMKTKFLFVLLFLLILPGAFILSNRTEYAFDDAGITELIESPSREAMHMITDTFDDETAIAALVPRGDYEAETAVLAAVGEFPEIRSATGLANIEIEPGKMLTDAYTPRMFSLLLGIDYEEARLLFQAYGAEHDQFQSIFGNADEYEVPLIDLFLYLFEKMDQGIVTLDGERAEQVEELRGTLERGVAQLRGENYDRLVFTASVPAEGEESVELVERIRAAAEEHYESGSVLVVGAITNARDLADSFNSDSLRINFLTIGFVFTILLFTFHSVWAAVILVFVIQGSIWINFSCSTIMGTVSCFVTYMIVSAIQMGATIDYAIVIMNRYLSLKTEYPKKEAMAKAVNHSFPTIMTSGTIMTVAGLLIAYRVSDVYVGHIGLAVGRGAFISVILVLSVLPQLIVLTDRLIEKTTFTIRTDFKENNQP